MSKLLVFLSFCSSFLNHSKFFVRHSKFKMTITLIRFCLVLAIVSAAVASAAAKESWTQFKFDERHSGNVLDRTVQSLDLGLAAAIPLTDAIFTAPVVADGRIYAIDGSGVVFCIDWQTFDVIWKFESRGGKENCNNVSSPAMVGHYLHFGTTVGRYYILDRRDGSVIKEIQCGDPIFSAPVVAGERVYFATLGAKVYALEPNGEVCWTWDFVEEEIGFDGNRWVGAQWYEFKEGRATWRDHFCCSRNISAFGKTIVMPAGGRTVFLEDTGDQPKKLAIAEIPEYAGREFAAAFGQSMGENGEVYVQWHRRDNAGRVEILKLHEGQVETSFVSGTQTAMQLDGLMSLCSVSLRGRDVYRCRPEADFAFCRHTPGSNQAEHLGGYPSIASPILLKEHGVYGGLDGRLYITPLTGDGSEWSFKTAFGKPIIAPAAVCDGRIVFGCEDGYLYVLGPHGKGALPTRDLGLETIRSPLTSKFAGAEFDWFTNYGNLGHTNWNDQGIKPPLKMKWVRRYNGTFKHLPVCGGGRMYTHTSEGQVFAVEQETGRLLWRRYSPGVHLSFTAPIYYRQDGKERLLVPQAGMKHSRLRCLDAATGQVLWEVPFTGSPSWSRQAPPIVYNGLAIYASGSGKYAAHGSDKHFVQEGDPTPSKDGAEVMSWLYSHDNPYYPKDNKPLIWAWDIETGKEVWAKDFSKYGKGGNDCGLCLMDGELYYSTFFGYSNDQRKRRGLPTGPNGLTASLDPMTGDVDWTTTDHYVTAGCTISGADGRLYLGGYNPPDESTNDRFIFCLDARDGSLVWKSPPLSAAVNVITVGDDFLFSNARGSEGNVLDKDTGEIVSQFNMRYACTRFTVSGSYVLGSNMDMIDLAGGNQIVSTGPCIDSRECVGSTVSNGRIFYTSQASGLQVSQLSGEEAQQFTSPWER